MRVTLVIAEDDPRADDIRALLERHLAFNREVTPPEGVHALDVDGLLDPAVTFFSARIDGQVVGVGALKQLDDSHAELKSMHTVQAARRQGVGRAMVVHLLSVAAERNYQRVSLETGAMPAFAPARSLYTKVGFRPCPPYGEYVGSPTSVCMTITVGSVARTSDQE
jgi:putative acetyltransferase